MKMSQIKLALLVASSAAVAALTTAAPVNAAQPYQWCVNHRGSMECYYTSYQQCQASASGWGVCVENSFFRPERFSAPAQRSYRG